jgi:hypothetical protein
MVRAHKMAREACATRATSQELNGALTVTPAEPAVAFHSRVGLPPRPADPREPTTSDRREHTPVRRLVDYAWRHEGITAF